MTKRRLKLIRSLKKAAEIVSAVLEVIREKGPCAMVLVGIVLMLGTAGQMDLNTAMMVPDAPSLYRILAIGILIAVGGICLMMMQKGDFDEDY